MTVKVEQPEQAAADEFVRFDIHQRLQHLLMMVSFTVLAFTGLPLKFHSWAVSQWWIGLWGGIDSTRAVHHFFAYVMVFDCFYHLAYLAFCTIVLKRPFPYRMVPSLKDVTDLLQDLRYLLGLSGTRASYDRFSYREKFDYWAIFWGIPIMAVSGFILMYPVLVTSYLPGWVVPVALIAHTDEAMLAVGWIFIVHLFFSHLSPQVFPFNKSIFTGRVHRDLYREEHPLEYNRLVGPAEAESDEESA